MDILILDGYVDEPAILGVPPYISPYPRLLAGAAKGHDISYMTVDQFRSAPAEARFGDRDLICIIAGALVPGKYLRGTPMTETEAIKAARQASRVGVDTLYAGPLSELSGFEGSPLVKAFTHAPTGDADVYLHGLLQGEPTSRERTMAEWDQWSADGASVVSQHPDIDGPLIVELETYQGCVRFASGGCAFCKEPGEGRPEFRSPEAIGKEVEALVAAGVKHIRVGGQSCIVSYGTEELGKTDTPTPNPTAVEELFKAIRKAGPHLKVLHVDNANPAVIAEHPDEARKVLEILVEHCTSGNVLAFGLESADPEVQARCNLNATAEQCMKAIELVNEVGSEVGGTGLPTLLPGLNFLAGLPGETSQTYELNRQFLEKVLEKQLLVRRVNIRQVLGIEGTPIDPKLFRSFKSWVREEFDAVMLQRLLPRGTVLINVFAEKVDGHVTFGRQVGSYPLLVGIDHPFELGNFTDVAVTAYGMRSVTGVAIPIVVNSAARRHLEALPGLTKKGVPTILNKRPFKDMDALMDALDIQGADRDEFSGSWGQYLLFD